MFNVIFEEGVDSVETEHRLASVLSGVQTKCRALEELLVEAVLDGDLARQREVLATIDRYADMQKKLLASLEFKSTETYANRRHVREQVEQVVGSILTGK